MAFQQSARRTLFIQAGTRREASDWVRAHGRQLRVHGIEPGTNVRLLDHPGQLQGLSPHDFLVVKVGSYRDNLMYAQIESALAERGPTRSIPWVP